MTTTTSAPTAPSILIDAIWPRRDSGAVNVVRLAVLAIAGSALMAVSAKIQVPMWPVPMTMQTFAVLVIAMSFGFRLGAATLLLYLAEGAVGLPVFASGAGLVYLAGPTGGYLVGFFVAAALVGWLAEKGWDRTVLLTLVAMALGTAVIFGLGVSWLAIFLGDAGKAIASGLTPFLVGAAVKIVLAAAVLPVAWRLLSGRIRS
jgi:biotin transport system substrate-specific component